GPADEGGGVSAIGRWPGPGRPGRWRFGGGFGEAADGQGAQSAAQEGAQAEGGGCGPPRSRCPSVPHPCAGALCAASAAPLHPPRGMSSIQDRVHGYGCCGCLEAQGCLCVVRCVWCYQVRAVCASVCQYVTFTALST